MLNICVQSQMLKLFKRKYMTCFEGSFSLNYIDLDNYKLFHLIGLQLQINLFNLKPPHVLQ